MDYVTIILMSLLAAFMIFIVYALSPLVLESWRDLREENKEYNDLRKKRKEAKKSQ